MEGTVLRTAVVLVSSAGESEMISQMARKIRMSVYDGIYHVTSREARLAALGDALYSGPK